MVLGSFFLRIATAKDQDVVRNIDGPRDALQIATKHLVTDRRRRQSPLNKTGGAFEPPRCGKRGETLAGFVQWKLIESILEVNLREPFCISQGGL